METPIISIEEIEMKVIYVRFRGSYVAFRKNATKLLNQLIDYAKKYDLIVEDWTKILIMYHDNPYITKDNDLRTSVAMMVPLDAKIDETEDITSMMIQGKYMVGHFHMSPKEYGEAWDMMYHEYLFKGDEKPRDTFPFEMYITEPPRKFSDKSYTDIYVPIE